MAVSQAIVREPAATRRWRWLAPLLVLLALALLIMMPGLLAERGGEAGASVEGGLANLQFLARTP